ncbi:carboxylating nicotinate-nucleotide diphosphorylase [Methyloligella sp. 2.7D]|uniref:carboxylating nicotinate-nucleotide diphosphorylase n=1 Tax=unclassified Methyloligella TaxID=2625955 RepID=UPI00157C74E1|nr:carboxylating nicotinate-nucleotide diphosphorylase [Methyloligella sp. GL2]QKP78283.1 carboxylating nicotinate-nucleotide diphosphorylase [Methyloligella sp. GL2]
MSGSSPELTLPASLVEETVRTALEEDLGQAGDITTNAIIPAEAEGAAEIVARENGVIAGLEVAELAFALLDPECAFTYLAEDGDSVSPGEAVAHIEGTTRALLTAERVALNFLGHLSGIASLTRRFVEAVEGTGAIIVDTRKTTPHLRGLEKYAVRCGGGQNHRFGLYDAVLVKDNHIAAAGGIEPALAQLKSRVGHAVKIEVEVDRLDQLEEALRLPIDTVLLDNMDIPTLTRAVEMTKGKVTTEASGGVNLETVRGIAETGVELISVGALTHSPKNLDLGLDWTR